MALTYDQLRAEGLKEKRRREEAARQEKARAAALYQFNSLVALDPRDRGLVDLGPAAVPGGIAIGMNTPPRGVDQVLSDAGNGLIDFFAPDVESDAQRRANQQAAAEKLLRDTMAQKQAELEPLGPPAPKPLAGMEPVGIQKDMEQFGETINKATAPTPGIMSDAAAKLFGGGLANQLMPVGVKDAVAGFALNADNAGQGDSPKSGGMQMEPVGVVGGDEQKRLVNEAMAKAGPGADVGSLNIPLVEGGGLMMMDRPSSGAPAGGSRAMGGGDLMPVEDYNTKINKAIAAGDRDALDAAILEAPPFARALASGVPRESLIAEARGTVPVGTFTRVSAPPQTGVPISNFGGDNPLLKDPVALALENAGGSIQSGDLDQAKGYLSQAEVGGTLRNQSDRAQLEAESRIQAAFAKRGQMADLQQRGSQVRQNVGTYLGELLRSRGQTMSPQEMNSFIEAGVKTFESGAESPDYQVVKELIDSRFGPGTMEEMKGKMGLLKNITDLEVMADTPELESYLREAKNTLVPVAPQAGASSGNGLVVPPEQAKKELAQDLDVFGDAGRRLGMKLSGASSGLVAGQPLKEEISTPRTVIVSTPGKAPMMVDLQVGDTITLADGRTITLDEEALRQIEGQRLELRSFRNAAQ